MSDGKPFSLCSCSAWIESEMARELQGTFMFRDCWGVAPVFPPAPKPPDLPHFQISSV